jgi:hypothetical protein
VTHSWLSPGNSLPLTVVGGDGDDDFTVYNDQAQLTLNGEGRQRPLHRSQLRRLRLRACYIVKAPNRRRRRDRSPTTS